jgi:hypothetical protein
MYKIQEIKKKEKKPSSKEYRKTLFTIPWGKNRVKKNLPS